MGGGYLRDIAFATRSFFAAFTHCYAVTLSLCAASGYIVVLNLPRETIFRRLIPIKNKKLNKKY
jgi:hypothetical protein